MTKKRKLHAKRVRAAQGRAESPPHSPAAQHLVQPRPARSGRSLSASPPRGLARLLAWPPELSLRRIVALALLAVFGFVVAFGLHDQRLAPHSIVSLQRAWNPERAAPILQAWGAAGRQVARQSLLIDFGFMPAYALLFSGLVLILARQARGRWQQAGLWLAVAPFAAWLFDLVENFAHLRVLEQPANPPPAALALGSAAAALKFGLLGACLAYIGLMLARLRRRAG